MTPIEFAVGGGAQQCNDRDDQRNNAEPRAVDAARRATNIRSDDLFLAAPREKFLSASSMSSMKWSAPAQWTRSKVSSLSGSRVASPMRPVEQPEKSPNGVARDAIRSTTESPGGKARVMLMIDQLEMNVIMIF